MGRSFWLLFAARTTSRLGDGFFFIAVSWLIYARTHSAIPLGAIWAVYLLVAGLGQAVLGPVPDLWDRRRLMMELDIARGVLFLVGALALSRLPALGAAPLYLLFLLRALLGLPYGSAAGALIAQVVGKAAYRRANVLMQGGSEAMYFVGPALGGYFIARFGATAAIGFDGGALLASAALLVFLRPHGKHDAPRASSGYCTALLDGARIVIRTPRILSLTLLELTAAVADSAFLVLSVPLVRSVLHGTPSGVGLLESAASLGVIAASPFIQPIARRAPRAFLAAGPLLALMSGAIGLVPRLAWAIGTQLAFGAAAAVVHVEIDTGFQSTVPQDLLGGSLMLRTSLANIGAAATAAAAGILALHLGITTAFVATAAAALLLAAWPTALLAMPADASSPRSAWRRGDC